LGDVEVPANRLWGAQTQRSYINFPIGVERFRWGRPVIRALGILKKCAARANGELGQLPEQKVHLIVRAAQEVTEGRWDNEFPLVVFQTGPGTQTNISSRRSVLFAPAFGSISWATLLKRMKILGQTFDIHVRQAHGHDRFQAKEV